MRLFLGSKPLTSSSKPLTGATFDSLYLELARDQKICSRQREFVIERGKYVTAYTKGLRLQFEIERSSRQRVFDIERVNCIYSSKKSQNGLFCHFRTFHTKEKILLPPYSLKLLFELCLKSVVITNRKCLRFF